MRDRLRVGIVSKGLNESPSEKEGKLAYLHFLLKFMLASMKAPPKRKGNPAM